MRKIIESALIGLLISLSISYGMVTFGVLNENAFISGQQLLLQFVVSAIFGIVVGVSTLIYNIERISFALQIAMHFILVSIFVGIAGYFGEWFEYGNVRSMVNTYTTVLIIYVITWFMFYIKTKHEIREINKLLEKRQEM